MTGPPATMISHMRRHDTVTAATMPCPFRVALAVATSAGNRVAARALRWSRDRVRNSTLIAPASAVLSDGRARSSPARHDAGVWQIPAIAETRRHDADPSSDGRDEARVRRRAAAVMRHQYDVGRRRLSQKRLLGICLGIGHQQRAAAWPGNMHNAGIVIVAAGGFGPRMQHAEFDAIPAPACAAPASRRGHRRLHAWPRHLRIDGQRIAQRVRPTRVIVVVMAQHEAIDAADAARMQPGQK